MKRIKQYNNFINESLKDKMKGKTDNEIKDALISKSLKDKFYLSCINEIIPDIKKLINNDSLKLSVNDLYELYYKRKTINELIKHDKVLKILKDDIINNYQTYNDFIENLEYNPSFYENVEYGNNDYKRILVKHNFTNRIKEIFNDIINNIKYKDNLKVVEIYQPIFNFYFTLLHDYKKEMKKYYFTDKYGQSVDYYVNDYFVYVNTPHDNYLILSDKIIDYIKNGMLNESLKDKMIGKTDNEIKKRLSKFGRSRQEIIKKLNLIRELGLSDRFLPSDKEIEKVIGWSAIPRRLELIKKYNFPDRFLPDIEKVKTRIKYETDIDKLYIDFLRFNYNIGAKLIIDMNFLKIENPTERQKKLNFALKESFSYRKIELSEYLLKNGADINVVKWIDGIDTLNPELKKLKEIYDRHKYRYKINESLKDKMKGKSEDDVEDGINDLIHDIASSLHGWGEFNHYDNAVYFITKNYKDLIRKLVNDGSDYDSIKDEIIIVAGDALMDLNESVRDKMSGKNFNDIKNELKKLNITDRLNKINRYKLPIESIVSDNEIKSFLSGLNVFEKIDIIERYNLPKKFLPSKDDINKSLPELLKLPAYNLLLQSIKFEYFDGIKKVVDLIKNNNAYNYSKSLNMPLTLEDVISIIAIKMYESNDYEKWLQYLIDNGADINSFNNHLMRMAINEKDKILLKVLVNNNVKFIPKEVYQILNESIRNKMTSKSNSGIIISLPKLDDKIKDYLIDNNFKYLDRMTYKSGKKYDECRYFFHSKDEQLAVIETYDDVDKVLKYLKSFNKIDESLKDKMIGKSEDEIYNNIKNGLSKNGLTYWDYAKYWVEGNSDIKSLIEDQCNKDEKMVLKGAIKTYINSKEDKYTLLHNLQYTSLFNSTNESLKDKMIGKSEDEIKKKLMNKTIPEQLGLIVKYGYFDLLKKLLNKELINDSHFYDKVLLDTLQESILKNNYEISEYLFNFLYKKGVNLEIDSYSDPLNFFYTYNNDDIVNKILDTNVRLDTNNYNIENFISQIVKYNKTNLIIKCLNKIYDKNFIKYLFGLSKNYSNDNTISIIKNKLKSL